MNSYSNEWLSLFRDMPINPHTYTYDIYIQRNSFLLTSKSINASKSEGTLAPQFKIKSHPYYCRVLHIF